MIYVNLCPILEVEVGHLKIMLKIMTSNFRNDYILINFAPAKKDLK